MPDLFKAEEVPRSTPATRTGGLRPKCLCLDLETSIDASPVIHKVAAWRPDTGEKVVFSGQFSSAELGTALARVCRSGREEEASGSRVDGDRRFGSVAASGLINERRAPLAFHRSGIASNMNVQLDLFLDSRAVVLANDAVRAIGERDAASAARHVSALRVEADDYPALRSLEILACALAEWQRPSRDATSILSAVASLEDVIAPAAREAFAARADDVLAPFFRDLADASRGLAYEASRSKAHRAWLSMRCADWEQAEYAALGIPGANGIPDALHWLAVARHRRRGLAAARPTLFALAWRDPPRLAELIDELQDEALERDYRRFNGACEWANTAAADLPAWFPAWYVFEHPAAAGDFESSETSMAPPVRTARLVARILELERRGDWKPLVALRDQFRRLNADLFSLYMARREVSRWR